MGIIKILYKNRKQSLETTFQCQSSRNVSEKSNEQIYRIIKFFLKNPNHFNSFHHIKFKKNLKNRLKKEFKSADFRPKKAPIYPDLGVRIFLKNTKQSLKTTIQCQSLDIISEKPNEWILR